MSEVITIVLLSWLAGFTAFLGGTTAWIEGSAESARKQEIILVFKDIAPQANMPRRWAPLLGAVFGFLIGMLGKQLIG